MSALIIVFAVHYFGHWVADAGFVTVNNMTTTPSSSGFEKVIDFSI